MRAIRKLRHWKQQFDPNAKFILRRGLKFNGEILEQGAPIPDELFNNKAKLRRFWESRTIELWEFDAPDVATGKRKESIDPTTELEKAGLSIPEGIDIAQNGPWYTVTDAEGVVTKYNGMEALIEYLSGLAKAQAEADAASQDSPPVDPPVDPPPASAPDGLTVPDGYTVSQAGPYYTVTGPNDHFSRLHGRTKVVEHLASLAIAEGGE